MRGTDNQSRADEYHGREAVKRSTEAAYEEFSTDPAPAAEKADADLRDPSLYVNRELSMLDFFERVSPQRIRFVPSSVIELLILRISIKECVISFRRQYQTGAEFQSSFQ